MRSDPLKRSIIRELKVSREDSFSELLKDRLVISTHKYVHLPKLDDILFIQAENNYSRIYLVDGTEILASKTLKSLSGRLPVNRFWRSHAAFLVNLDKVTGIKKNGSTYIVLNHETEIPVSAKYRIQLFKNLRKACH